MPTGLLGLSLPMPILPDNDLLVGVSGPLCCLGEELQTANRRRLTEKGQKEKDKKDKKDNEILLPYVLYVYEDRAIMNRKEKQDKLLQHMLIHMNMGMDVEDIMPTKIPSSLCGRP